MSKNYDNRKSTEDKGSADEKNDFRPKYDNTKGGRNHKNNSNKKSFDKRSFEKDRSPVTKGANDPMWYGDDFALRDAANLAYSNPVGTKFSLAGETTTLSPLYRASTLDKSVPGVMAVKIIPAIGVSVDNTSPVNLAARNIYTYVRHANSGHSNYDSPDLMLYLLAMDNLYSFYAFMVRTYAVLRTYSQKNRYYPEALIKAMGFDFTSLLGEIADFRYYINVCSKKISAFCTPSTMNYFKKHFWMYSNIYGDANLEKCQSYVYVPEGFYRYNEVAGAGQLDWVAWTSATTFAQLRTFGDSLIAKVVESEDLNIMSGDILKAYGNDKVFQVAEITEDFSIVPTYNEEVLTQIHNATACGTPVVGSLAITQDATTGAILSNPQFVNAAPGLACLRVLTVRSDAPTPADTMTGTRLMAIAMDEEFAMGSVLSHLDSCGDSICTSIVLYSFSLSGANWVVTATSDISSNVRTTVAVHALTADLEKFDWHPAINVWTVTATSSEMTAASYTGTYLDVDNYTLVNYYDLRKMNETALLNEFEVPRMGAAK